MISPDIGTIADIAVSENIDVKNIFDIGCLDGEDGKYLQSRFPNSNLFLIEADQGTFAKNKENYIGKNIYAFSYAVFDYDGEIKFFCKSDHGISSVFNRGDVYPGNISVVPCLTLDSFCEKYSINQIDIMKLDVEGAAFNVLMGAKKILSKTKLIHIETEDVEYFQGQHLKIEVDEILKNAGFNLLKETSYHIGNGNQYDSIWMNKV